jgi:cytochrome b561
MIEKQGKYTGVAIALHWVIGLMIIFNATFAFFMKDLGDENIRLAIDTHKAIGISVLGLVIMRVLWRITHEPPALPTTFQKWEMTLSKFTHGLLYFMMFAMPITGWLHDSAWNAASEIPLPFFGLFDIPRAGWIMNMEEGAKKELHGLLGDIHETSGFIFIGLIVLHISGALKHQFIDKHPELKRMLP